jgi:hypothetical protein
MKIQALFSAASSLALKTIIAPCVSFYFLPLSEGAQTCSQSPYCRFTDCMPVVYIFRHAEEGSNATALRQNTLLRLELRSHSRKTLRLRGRYCLTGLLAKAKSGQIRSYRILGRPKH